MKKFILLLCVLVASEFLYAYDNVIPGQNNVSVTQNSNNKIEPYQLQEKKHYKIDMLSTGGFNLPFEADICAVKEGVTFVTGDGDGNVEGMEIYIIEKVEKRSQAFFYTFENGNMMVGKSGDYIIIRISVDGKTNTFYASSTPYSAPTLKRK